MMNLALKDSNVLRIGSASDIHLLHRKNHTADIITNLNREFSDEILSSLDILILAGDVFDDLATANSPDMIDVDFWIVRLLRKCKQYNIVLFVLEGTPGHDREQSLRFVTLNKLTEIDAELRYIDDLTIRYEERFDMNFLFVPDEWGDKDPNNTLAAVKDLLKAKGLDKVDFAIMHGQFDYQMPAHFKIPCHDSSEYLKIVKHLIFIGHVHTFSQHERIIAHGSFDRLAHGEESPKGWVTVDVTLATNEYDIKFRENKLAKTFTTLNCIGYAPEDIIARVDKEVIGLREDSHLRIEAESTNPLYEHWTALKIRHPLIHFEKLPREQKEEKTSEVVNPEDEVYVPVIISSDNVKGLLMDRISRYNTDTSILETASTILDEVLK